MDLYFDEVPPTGSKADLVRFNQFSSPPRDGFYTAVHTILLDLSRPADELFSNFASETRYKIRRAEKDPVAYSSIDPVDRNQTDTFADFYDHHAGIKGLPKVSRKRLAILTERRVLTLSFVRDAAGNILVANTFLRTARRVRGLQLAVGFRASADPSRRALIGRANRYARWMDILHFQKRGLEQFDFGGWYPGTTDQELLRVNGFKEEFSGTVVQEFSWERPLTTRGRIGVALMQRGNIFLNSSPAGVDTAT